MKKTIISAICFLFTLLSSHAQQSIAQFKAGDRVALVGDSITHGGHYHSYIWLYYMTRFPDMPITFLNCGVGGDTSWDIVSRWQYDVVDKKPTYVTLTFGMNDTGYFGVYNNEKSEKKASELVQKSLAGFAELEKSLEKDFPGAEIVMIGGSPYDETSRFNRSSLKDKNAAICRVIEGQKAAAERHGWGFVDFNSPMVEISLSEQSKDSTFSFSRQDRIHPDQDGQMVMAYLFLKAQGLAGRKVAHVDIDARKAKVRKQEYCRISSLEVTDEGLSFDYLAESLPYPCDTISENGWANVRSQRDGAALVPFMEEFNQETLCVGRLPEGTYRLTIDGEFIDDLSSERLAAGVNLAAYVNTPQYRQASVIMYMNEERFEIEKRMREYIWMQSNMFRGTDRIFADDSKAMEQINARAQKDPFVSMSNYWYRKSRNPEIREIWQEYMDILVEKIYAVNKPLSRRVVLEKLL